VILKTLAAGEWIRFRVFSGHPPEDWSTWDPDTLWQSRIEEDELGDATLVLKSIDDGSAVLRAIRD
jgi:hypothetical protein